MVDKSKEWLQGLLEIDTMISKRELNEMHAWYKLGSPPTYRHFEKQLNGNLEEFKRQRKCTLENLNNQLYQTEEKDTWSER